MALAKRRSLFPSFLDDFFNVEGVSGSGNVPAVNIKESDKEYHLEVAAPGMNSKDFDLEVNDDMMTISCEHQSSSEEKDEGNYTRREYNYQSFERSFSMPDGADAQNVSANYRNGVLDITIPKKEQGLQKRQTRRIEIK